MQTTPMDLDGAFVVTARREFGIRPRRDHHDGVEGLSPRQFQRLVDQTFPELTLPAVAVMGAEARRLSVNTHGVSPCEQDPGPLPSYKVKSRIKSRRQKKAKRRRG